MISMDTAPTAIEVVALLSSATSHCEVQMLRSDDELGDPIQVQCGSATTPLGRTLKGVSVDRIRACQVVLTVNAVNRPRLLNIGNCAGHLNVSEVGDTWVRRIQQSNDIKTGSIEYISYKKDSHNRGCYRVTVTYDSKPSQDNTTYIDRKRKFCIGDR